MRGKFGGGRLREKRSDSEPESAEEYLQAAVELEEAGEKWRAGDTVKSLRFFNKAIDQYDAGLRTYPKSFDLAYNKARLQYDITQQPRLLRSLPAPLTELLAEAARSHEYALELEPSNPDALFNLAQVYSSRAEAGLEASNNEADYHDASKQCKKALELLHKCFTIQEEQLSEQQQEQRENDAQQASAPEIDVDDSIAMHSSQPVEEVVWASLAKPVTAATLIETCAAQLDVLKVLSQAQTPDAPDDLEWIEQAVQDVNDRGLKTYLAAVDDRKEIISARVSFLVAYATARYRLLRTDEATYDAELTSATISLNGNEDPEALCLLADAHIDINTAIGERTARHSSADRSTSARLRWQHLTTALELYTKASKTPQPPNLARIHISRGDCELLRARLADAPITYKLAVQSVTILLKNAIIFYTAARSVLTNAIVLSPEAKEDLAEVETKIALATAKRDGSLDAITQLLQLGNSRDGFVNMLEEIREQDIFSEAVWRDIHTILAHAN